MCERKSDTYELKSEVWCKVSEEIEAKRSLAGETLLLNASTTPPHEVSPATDHNGRLVVLPINPDRRSACLT